MYFHVGIHFAQSLRILMARSSGGKRCCIHILNARLLDGIEDLSNIEPLEDVWFLVSPSGGDGSFHSPVSAVQCEPPYHTRLAADWSPTVGASPSECHVTMVSFPALRSLLYSPLSVSRLMLSVAMATLPLAVSRSDESRGNT